MIGLRIALQLVILHWDIFQNIGLPCTFSQKYLTMNKTFLYGNVANIYRSLNAISTELDLCGIEQKLYSHFSSTLTY
jgi:hypothetical protein